MKLVWVSNAEADHPAAWWGNLKVGLPKASQHFSVLELVDRGMIGLYREVQDERKAISDAGPGGHGVAGTRVSCE